MSVTVQFKSILTATRVIAFGILTEMNTTPVIIDALIDFLKIRRKKTDETRKFACKINENEFRTKFHI